jgi:hypothetical protein
LIAAKFGIGQSRSLLNNTPDTVSLVPPGAGYKPAQVGLRRAPARSYLHACGRLRFAFASSYHEGRLADPIEHIVDELDRYRVGGI